MCLNSHVRFDDIPDGGPSPDYSFGRVTTGNSSHTLGWMSGASEPPFRNTGNPLQRPVQSLGSLFRNTPQTF